MDSNEQLVPTLISTGLWLTVGLAAFGFAFWLMGRLAPFSIRKEIEEDHNVALAIVIASVVLGLAIIIAGVVH